MFIMVFVATPVFADTGLTVTFEQQPLFSEANFLPGDTVARSVVVKNTTGNTQTVITGSDNEVSGGSFSEQFTFIISDSTDNQVYFSGTLQDFFDADLVNLGSIAHEEERSFVFSATLGEDTDNQMQGAMIGFDLLVGFFGGEVITDNQITSFAMGGGGGNGITDIERLDIINIEVSTQDLEEGTAVITWNTTLSGTSQVVYGESNMGPFSINITLPNFGYPMASTKDTEYVDSHSIELVGLTPFTWYKFRVATERVTEHVSSEHQFYFGPDLGGDFPILENELVTIPINQSPTILSFTPGATSEEIQELEEETLEENEGELLTGTQNVSTQKEGANDGSSNALAQAQRGLLASMIFGLPEGVREKLTCVSVSLVFILAIYLLWLLAFERKRHEYENAWEFLKFQLRFIISSGVLGVVLLVLLKLLCSIVPFVIILVAYALYAFYSHRKSIRG